MRVGEGSPDLHLAPASDESRHSLLIKVKTGSEMTAIRPYPTLMDTLNVHRTDGRQGDE